MPSGPVTLIGSRGKNISQPGIDEIFESFRKKKNLKIKMKLPKEENHRWRPQGTNTYELEILSIERTISVGSTTSHDQYSAKAVLVGMNGIKAKFPEHFSYPSKGPENAVELRFNSKKKLELEYSEYLTL